MASAQLTEQGALGYITELLSGDFNAAFGRSSHHQVWSEAMVVTPMVRGLLGIEPIGDGSRLRIAPQLPPDWERVSARRLVSNGVRLDLEVTRAAGALTIRVSSESGSSVPGLVIAPALPLDAQVESVRVNGQSMRPTIQRTGDVQFAELEVASPTAQTTAEFRYRGGSDVYVEILPPHPGARSKGLRILRSRADARALRLTLEGVNGQSYELSLRTPRQPGTVEGATLVRGDGGDPMLRVAFEGPPGEYSRRQVSVQLR
jgi:hypothetical protein